MSSIGRESSGEAALELNLEFVRSPLRNVYGYAPTDIPVFSVGTSKLSKPFLSPPLTMARVLFDPFPDDL